MYSATHRITPSLVAEFECAVRFRDFQFLTFKTKDDRVRYRTRFSHLVCGVTYRSTCRGGVELKFDVRRRRSNFVFAVG